ncbi:MAG: hypothetical protein AABX16_00870 [Nanoarchaeota archaeon]
MKKLTTVVIASSFIISQFTEAAARSFRNSYKTYQIKNLHTEIADQAPMLELPKGFIMPSLDDKTPIRVHQRFDLPSGKIEYRWREIPYRGF